MTRETKIGLLVGLAFIIVIGILLSDHINSSTDPAPAQASKIYDSVERSVNAPDARQQGQSVIVTPASVVPQDPVPTGHDVPSTTGGVAIIKIQPGGDPSYINIPSRAPINQESEAQPPSGDNTPGPAPTSEPPVASNNASADQEAAHGAPGRLQQIARQNGEDVVAIGTPPVPAGPEPSAAHGGASLAIQTRQVKAEEGDTVCKLAAKYLGGNTKSNREAIIKANPSMTPDGHLVIVGRTYAIPSPVATPESPPAPVPPAAQAGSVHTALAYYTVKENDNLWKIAAEQLGSGNRWTEIRDLNQDLLKGRAQLQVNMRLKLPPKSG